MPPPLGRQAEHRVAPIGVCRPDVSFAVYVKTVRKRKHPLAPGIQQFARRIEFQNWPLIVVADASGSAGGQSVEASMQHPDISLGIKLDPNGLPKMTSVHTRGELRPGLDLPIWVRLAV